MARTLSSMVALGTNAPQFRLPDVRTNEPVTLDTFRPDAPLVVMFICNHCPFVKHIRSELVRLASEYQKKGVEVVAISSNDAVAYPADGPEKMREEAETFGYSFPYLYDESQSVARSYDATCTPDFFVYDKNRALVYRGQLDDSRPDNGVPVTGKDLRAALDCLLANKPVPAEQTPSLGCNIKWK